MSGLKKAKKYDWKDSNLALIGSDLDRKVKKESAGCEPAWKNAGEKVGIQIWRIVKFEVTHWPKEQYGNFYTGDTYIVLNTYKKPDSEELLYDLHFWIGKYSTQDEYGTAAYKTVELDSFLDDKPVQHREVHGNESKLFKSYFKEFVTMKGGAETGFNRLKPEVYKPKLMHCHRENGSGLKVSYVTHEPVPKKIQWVEVGLKRANLKDSDVFLIDLGQDIYQWNGVDASHFEKFAAQQRVQKLEAERGCKVRTHHFDMQTVSDTDAEWARIIPEGKPKKDKEAKGNTRNTQETTLYRVAFNDPKYSYNEDVRFVKVAVGAAKVKGTTLEKDEVYILQSTDRHCYLWIGSENGIDKRRKSLGYAHKFAMEHDPLAPFSIEREGAESESFKKAF